jgi:hypothetical protein
VAAKITLITPPDIYQNNQKSVLFIDLNNNEQDLAIEYLKTVDEGINVYFYSGETNVPWLLHALSCSDYKYINLNNMSAVTGYLAGYILSMPGVCYSTTDINVSMLYSYINVNKVDNVVNFLERVISGKE